MHTNNKEKIQNENLDNYFRGEQNLMDNSEKSKESIKGKQDLSLSVSN